MNNDLLREYIKELIIEANEYSWEVSNRKNMKLDQEGMEQSEKDKQEKYLKSMGLMESPVYLIESHRRPSRTTFGTLLEQREAGFISERKMIKLWEASVDYQINELLTETLMDDLASAYETVKGGAIKLKDKITDAAVAAWEKANEFILNLSAQAYTMATKSVDALKSAISKLAAANAKFKKNHPILHKIVSIIIVMIIIFAIMSMFSGEAQAAVQAPGGGGQGGNISEGQYTALRGMLSKYGDAGTVGDMIDSGKAIEILDNAYKSKDVVNLSELGRLNQIGFEKIVELNNQAKGGDQAAWGVLKQWLEVGKGLQIQNWSVGM
jgi:hypothetical protein